VADRHVLRPRLFVELLEFVIDGLDAEFLEKMLRLASDSVHSASDPLLCHHSWKKSGVDKTG
jgi:hypothetical protein